MSTTVSKLQRSFAYRALKWFPSDMLAWMDRVSKLADTILPFGIQFGTLTMINGVAAGVVANISANTRIAFGKRVFNGAAGSPIVTAMVVGEPGPFEVSSINPATGGVVATDQGSYFWIAVG